jgi:hypothetical protein
MNAERTVKWEPIADVMGPCADISYWYDGPVAEEVTVKMLFSRVVGNNPARDLILTFRGAISLRWEPEHFGLNPLPEPLPKLSSDYTFPLLRIENSKWLESYVVRNPFGAKGRVHFALIALNDLLQILAQPDVQVNWVKS